MTTAACPLCAGKDAVPLDLDEPLERTGTNVLCRRCGLIYHFPAATPHDMAAYYADSYSDDYSASEDIAREMARQRIKVLKDCDVLKTGSPLLEIGCARGEFLAEAARLGLEVSGVEPSRAMAAHCREAHGLPVATGVYDTFPERPGAYGLVCLFHVLEHVPDPLGVLRRIRRELRPGGHLFLEVPTLGECQLALIFKAIHPTTFVRETLEAMLRLAGFRVERLKQRGYHLQALATPEENSAPPLFADAERIHDRVVAYLATRREVLSRIRSRLQGLLGRPGGAIYGAGLNTLDLNQVFPLSQLQLGAAFDADPRKQGHKILGLDIHGPEDLAAWRGNYLIISSYAFQEEIRRQCAFLLDRGVELITLYDK